MDETVANIVGLCEKYQGHKANGIAKKKAKSDKEIALEAFGIHKEEKDGK